MKKIFLFLLMISASFIVNAQSKIGYIDSREILSSLPEISKLDSSYNVYAKLLSDELNKMSENFQIKTNEFNKDSINMPSSIKELKRKELVEDVEKFKNFQQQAEKDLGTQKEKLLNPLREKVKAAIDKVAKENKFDYIVDIANSPFVFANEKLNVTSLVKQKLK